VASQAVFTQGTQIQLGDGGSPESFLTIAEVKSISGPSLSRDTIDVTTHSSTGGVREFINGLADGGEVSFDVNFVPGAATHNNTTGMLSLWASGRRANFKIIFPTSPAVTWSFNGVLTAFEMSAPTDEVLGASVTIKVAGSPTLS
jgi:predicted secreted protein